MRFAIVLFAVLIGMSTTNQMPAETIVWIGMGAPINGEPQGIYRATLDTKTGALSKPVLAAEIRTPEFLAVHPRGKHIYAACQLPDGAEGIAAFQISNDGNSLTFLNGEPTRNGRACHVATDREGKCLFSAQYGGGTVTAFPIGADGRIQPRTEFVQHTGSGPNKARQEAPHPHWVGTDLANRFLLVPDLGKDQIVIYAMDVAAGKLKSYGHGTCPAGSGPRHLVFHPNGMFAYVVNELDVSITAFAYDAGAGTLTPCQTIDSLPNELLELPCTGAEISIHPRGEFLYASTRGHDSVSAFRIHPRTGQLTFVECEPIRGVHPRSINLDPSGKWLLAAGRDSNTIAVFRIDAKSGGLVFNQKIVNSPAPICIVFQATPSR